ncbi:hypothetical protein PVAP13_2NG111146 [Panicum virgatum]|uniref:Uncharacterized protein n=1 Tax=Panicum virgatum TaxID=38727 RepID=A0A8T0VBA4_PANVG|nr:hypothetical protein PVAP13_2NG111146 [Panicum virgatum]
MHCTTTTCRNAAKWTGRTTNLAIFYMGCKYQDISISSCVTLSTPKMCHQRSNGIFKKFSTSAMEDHCQKITFSPPRQINRQQTSREKDHFSSAASTTLAPCNERGRG